MRIGFAAISRWSLNIAAAVSALLFVIVVIGWIASYWRMENIGGHTALRADQRQRGGGLHSACGTLSAEFWSRRYTKSAPMNREAKSAAYSHFHSPIDDSSTTRANHDAWLADIGAVQFIGFAFAKHQMDASGFGATGNRPTPRTPQTLWVIDLPYWSVALVSGVLPLTAMMRLRRTRLHKSRAAAGCCAACGYDVRASSDRCPECGAPVAPKAAVVA
jgi:hypothetical protein